MLAHSKKYRQQQNKQNSKKLPYDWQLPSLYLTVPITVESMVRVVLFISFYVFSIHLQRENIYIMYAVVYIYKLRSQAIILQLAFSL